MLEIKSSHFFSHQNKNILIDFEELEVYSIEEKLADELNLLKNGVNESMAVELEEKLKNLSPYNSGNKSFNEFFQNGNTTEDQIIAVTLFISQACNLRCTYCYGNEGTYGSSGMMDFRTARTAIDWLIDQSADSKGIYLSFFGGEPLLNFPVLRDAVKYAQMKTSIIDKNVKFHVVTNGTLFTDEIIEFIKKNEIHISVSFDGPKEIQDAQRPFADGRGSYDVILPGLRKLLKEVPDTFGHAVILDGTEQQNVQKALREIGFKEMSVSVASSSLFDEKTSLTSKTRDTANIMEQLEIETENWITFTKERDEDALKTILLKSQLFNPLMTLRFQNKRLDTCGAGKKNVAVSANGDIYLCHRFVGMEDYKLGNVEHGQLKRGEYMKSAINCNEKCKVCFAKYYCGGGCKHDNLGSCGSVFQSPEDICSLRCREFELAAYIFCSLNLSDLSYLEEVRVFPKLPCPFDF